MNLKLIRNIAFWSFLGLYLVVAPAISLHALGYVIDPKTFRLVKTGIISISTEPERANVWVNEKLQRDTTSFAVTGLLPNVYQVKVAMEGYQPVEMELSVAAEEVTKIEHLLLIPEQLNYVAPVSASTYYLSHPNQSRLIFLFSRSDRAITIYSFDLRKKKLSLLLELNNSSIGELRGLQVVLSDDEKKAFFMLRDSLNVSQWLVNLSGEADALDLSKLIPELFSNLRFHPKNSRELFYLSDDFLNLFDIESRTRKKIFQGKVRSFEAIDDRLFILTDDFRLLSSTLQGKEIKDLLPERGLYRLLFEENARHAYQMFLTAQESAFWLREDGVLITNRLPHFIDDNVKGAQLVEGSEKLLYWKSNELWIIDMEVLVERERAFFEKGPKKTLLFTSKRPIISAQAIRGGNQVVLASDDELVLVQSDPHLLGKTFLLAKHRMKKRISFFTDEPSGDLYWIDQAENEMPYLRKARLFEESMFPFSIRLKKAFQSPNEVSL